MKTTLTSLLLLFFTVTCSNKNSGFADSLMRVFGYVSNSSSTLSLSISGTLSQDGTTVSNTLITTSASTLNTSTSKLQVRSTSSETIRCVDYDLSSGYIKCLLIIDTSALTNPSTSGCYQIYYSSVENNQISSIAKYQSITTGNKIQHLHQGKIPTGVTGFALFSCSNSSSPLATATLLDYASSDGILTDSNGTYTVDVESGKYHTLSIRRASKDLGDIYIDLTAINTEAGLQGIQNDPSTLSIAIPSGFTHTLTVNGPSVASGTGTNSSSAGTTIDIATLSNEASKDSSLTAGTTTPITPGSTDTTISTFSYSASFYGFLQGSAITSQTPTIVGTINSCTVSPSLPTGLSLDSTTCTISGTPTTSQTSTSYTITASNSVGSLSTTISIQIYAGTWVQDSYLKSSNSGASDYFGEFVAIDGDYAIVGAKLEDNSATSIDNTDNGGITDSGTANDSGAAYIFKRDSGSGNWVQDAYLKPSNTEANDYFGFSVAISGNYAVVGAYQEDNNSTSINNTDNAGITDTTTTVNSGAAYVFKRDTSTGNWSQDAYLKPSNMGNSDNFGYSVSISGDYIIAPAYAEDNSYTGIDNTDNGGITDSGTASASGAAYIFKRDTSTGNWIQDAYLKASNAENSDYFGISAAIDGNYAIVGANYEDNGSTSINNTDNTGITDSGTITDSGSAYIFKRDTSTGNWILDAYLKASNNNQTAEFFGGRVAISGDYAIVGADREDNSSTSIVNTDNAGISDTTTINDAGAAYIFKRDSSTGDWIQDAYLKPSNTESYDYFGVSVSINGNYAVVGAYQEDNNATTINNTDDAGITDSGTASGSGAAYVFKRDTSTGNWSQDAYLKASNTGANDYFGNGVAISGGYIIVGADREDNGSGSINNGDNAAITDSGTNTDSGAAYIFKLQ
ncbi:MAG: putative Ig domain-containing protein [Spirochaetota bacterium]